MNKKYTIILLCILLQVDCFSQREQTIKLGVFSIHKDSIPYNGFVNSKQYTKVNEIAGSKIISANGYRIDANYSKSLFLLSEYSFNSNEVGSDLSFDDEIKTFLNFYKKDGTKIWDAKFEKSIEKCAISSDGNFVHLLRTCAFNCDNDFVTFNEKGEIIYKAENVIDFLSSENGKFVLILKAFSPNTQVIFRNFENNLDFEFHNRSYGLTLGDISRNGDYFSLFKDKELYSYNAQGKLLWSKEMNEFYYGISNDGPSYLSVDKNILKLNDNLKDIPIWVKDIRTDEFSFENCFFVENSSFIACIFSNKEKSKVDFIEQSGNVVGSLIVNIHHKEISDIIHVEEIGYLILKQGQELMEIKIEDEE